MLMMMMIIALVVMFMLSCCLRRAVSVLTVSAVSVLTVSAVVLGSVVDAVGGMTRIRVALPFRVSGCSKYFTLEISAPDGWLAMSVSDIISSGKVDADVLCKTLLRDLFNLNLSHHVASGVSAFGHGFEFPLGVMRMLGIFVLADPVHGGDELGV